ncbi:MAG: 1,4-dihydroxy-6-naphthoate synthase [Desulfobacteraceae bacterium]|nr:1,4-dihydroxy-6-naphthoate synthase [Desulfobacteraceae bacterium]
MKPEKIYDLAYSGCPNDTFIFKGIAKKMIDTGDFDFNIILEDVETLNQKAARGAYGITKLSFAALGNLLDKYALLRTGAALGMGCGPLVISRANRFLDDKGKKVIAVPGLGTTAYHLFRFYMDDLFSDVETKIVPMPFETIMPAVMEGKVDFGVIIHEGRFIYQNMNLEMKADLGRWWEDKTSLPIPLGCIAVKRSMDPALAMEIQTLIGRSIEHAFLHPAMGDDYIRGYAQEMEDHVIQRHIGLYVNEFSKDIGTQGTTAVTTFFEYAARAGLMQLSSQPLFAC